jgi:hypothetical protein
MTLSAAEERRLHSISSAFEIVFNACRAAAVIAGFEYHSFASASDRYVPPDGSPVPLNFNTDADRFWAMPRGQRESTNVYNDFDRALCVKLVAQINLRKYMPPSQMNVSIGNTRQTLLAVWSEFENWDSSMYVLFAVTKALHFHGMCTATRQIARVTEYIDTMFEQRTKITQTPDWQCVTLDTSKLLTLTLKNTKPCSSTQRAWMLECIKRVINIECINAARDQFAELKMQAMHSLSKFSQMQGCNEQNYWIYICAHECFADQTRRRVQLTQTGSFLFFLDNWRDKCLELCMEKNLFGSLVVNVVLAGVRCLFRMYFTSGRLFGDPDSVVYRRSLVSSDRRVIMSDLVRFMNERVFTPQIDSIERCQKNYTLITHYNEFEFVLKQANSDAKSRSAKAEKLFEFVEIAQQDNANASMLVCPVCCELVHHKDGAVFHAISQGPTQPCAKICCAVCWNKLVYASQCQKKKSLECPSCKAPAREQDMVAVDLMTNLTIRSLLVRCKQDQCRAVLKCESLDAHIRASHPDAAPPVLPALGRVMQPRVGQCQESQLQLWSPKLDLAVAQKRALWRQDRDLYSHQFWDFDTYNASRAPRTAKKLLSAQDAQDNPTLAGMLQLKDDRMQVFMGCTQAEMQAIFEHRLEPEVSKDKNTCYSLWQNSIAIRCYVLTQDNFELSKNEYRDQIKFWHKLACEFDSGPFAIVDPLTPIHAVLLHASHSTAHADRISEILGFKSFEQMQQCFDKVLQLTFADKMNMACKLVAPAHAQFLRSKYNLQ